MDLHRTKQKLLSLLHLKKRHPKPSSSSPLPLPSPSQPPALPSVSPRILSPLESLPTELRLQILTLLNLQSLKFLLLASPECSHIFLSSKRQVLKTVLAREVCPSLLAEAKLVWRVRHKWDEGHFESEIEVLADRERRTELENEEEGELLELAKLHFLIQSLTRDFCANVLRPTSEKGVKGENEEGKEWNGEISEMEMFRIQRALYRFELFAACFGGKGARARDRDEELRAQEMADLFFGERTHWEWNDRGIRMRPWEVEELACVRNWMVRVYGRVFDETRALVWEVDVEKERDELRCFMKEGVALEERARKQVSERNEFWERDQCEVLLMLGLPFLARMIKSESPEEKFELWKEHLIPGFMGAPAFLTAALETQPQSRHGHGHRRRLDFEGDFEDGPNAAWVQSKRNSSREYRDRWFLDDAEGWREWGYCLWDEERLKGWGFEGWNWRNGRRRDRGRWVCTPQVRSSGRVVPKWVWVADETA